MDARSVDSVQLEQGEIVGKCRAGGVDADALTRYVARKANRGIRHRDHHSRNCRIENSQRPNRRTGGASERRRLCARSAHGIGPGADDLGGVRSASPMLKRYCQASVSIVAEILGNIETDETRRGLPVQQYI